MLERWELNRALKAIKISYQGKDKSQLRSQN